MEKKLLIPTFWLPVFLGIFLLPGLSYAKSSHLFLNPRDEALQEGKQISHRINSTHEIVNIQAPKDSISFNLADIEKFSVTLTKIIEVAPPVISGVPLRANNVILNKDGHIFVSYNTEGEIQKGAIESISLKNLSKPKITSQILFPNADINALSFFGDSLYVTGASQYFSQSPAFTALFKVEKGRIIVDAFKAVEIPSYSGTDILATSSFVYAVSGSTGGVSILKRETLEEQEFIPLSDARAITKVSHFLNPIFSKKLWVLSGTPAKLNIIEKNDFDPDLISLKGGETPHSKLSIVSDKDLIFTAVNEGGVQVLCAADHKIIAQIPQVLVPGVPSSKTVTNSLALKDNFLFTANGEAGVAMYTLQRKPSIQSVCPEIEFEMLGELKLGKAGISANHLTVLKNLLFVADGAGGLKVLKIDKVYKYFWENLWP